MTVFQTVLYDNIKINRDKDHLTAQAVVKFTYYRIAGLGKEWSLFYFSWRSMNHLFIPFIINLLWLSLVAPAHTLALQIEELQNPQSFVTNTTTPGYFISSTNGEPDARDNNGFITKLNKDGHVVHLHFIQGGKNNTTLHAPKGMAIIQHILYVADLDAVRGFDTDSGENVVTRTMPPTPSQSGEHSLVDVLHVGEGFLYASDTHTNTIYRIDTNQDHQVTVLAQDEILGGPHGLALNPKTGHLVVTSWNTGRILEVDGNGKVTVVVSNGFFSSRFTNLFGADYDRWGNLYVADTTKGKIWRMKPNGSFQVIAEFLQQPTGISVDRENELILVPFSSGNAAEMNGLESPTKRKKKKRTLADYGFGFPKPPKKEPATK